MPTERDLERRRRVYLAVVALVFAVLVGQLANLTLIRRAEFVAAAERNRTRPLTITAPRGQIVDRNGTVLARSRPAFSVFIMPQAGADAQVIERLAGILGMTPSEIGKKIAPQKRYRRFYERVRLKTDLDTLTLTRLEEAKYQLPGVFVEVEPIRDYPLGQLAAHTLGYVRQVSEEDLASGRLGPDYRGGDLVGKSGLEEYYESVLRGQNGSRLVEVDSSFRPVRTLAGGQEAVPGNNLVLTLDSKLQQVAEQSLEAIIRRLQAQGRKGSTAKAGSLVALDVNTGQVLAIASYPAFDPNIFVGRLPPEVYAQLAGDPRRPFRNRAIQDVYAPASTFKMVPALGSLEDGIVAPDFVIFDTGRYWLYDRPRDWKPGGHGRTDFQVGISQSCDVFFYEVGRLMGIERIARWARAFGFGQRTGIDLAGEQPGLVPTPDWKQKALNEPWYAGETIRVAIGQSYLAATPLQLAQYVAAVANGGTRYRPYLVSAITNASGKVLKTFEPVVNGRVEAKPENWQIVKRGMLGVTRPGGTAYGAFADFPIPVAGKTGTAQVDRQEDNGVFVAYAPYDNPRIAVAVVVEEGGGGSLIAPAAEAVIGAYLGVDVPPIEVPTTGLGD